RDFLHGPPTRAGTSGSGRWVVRRPETMEDTMSSTIQITFDARDPRALSQFWRDVLGYVHPGPPGVRLEPGADPLAAWAEFLETGRVPGERRTSASALEDPDGNGPRICFPEVAEAKAAKSRVHLAVRTASELRGEARMDALDAECARLLALGATC